MPWRGCSAGRGPRVVASAPINITALFRHPRIRRPVPGLTTASSAAGISRSGRRQRHLPENSRSSKPIPAASDTETIVDPADPRPLDCAQVRRTARRCCGFRSRAGRRSRASRRHRGSRDLAGGRVVGADHAVPPFADNPRRARPRRPKGPPSPRAMPHLASSIARFMNISGFFMLRPPCGRSGHGDAKSIGELP